jgi:hypothetical protein
MRFVVLLFGLGAIPLTGLTGAAFLGIQAAFNFLVDASPEAAELVYPYMTSPTGATFGDTGVFLILAALYGALGVLLSLMRCGWQGALLLILPVALAAGMNPFSLVGTALQVFTGLLSFLVFPVPIESPTKKGAGDEEDED